MFAGAVFPSERKYPQRGADLSSGQCHGLRTKGSLVRGLAGLPFVVAFSKSHLSPA